MKILFVIDSTESIDSAATILAKSTAKTLATGGAIITVLEATREETNGGMVEGYDLVPLNLLTELKLDDKYNGYLAKGDGEFMAKLKSYFSAGMFWDSVEKFVFKSDKMREALTAEIDIMAGDEDFDAIIAFCDPKGAGIALSKARTKIKKASVMLDSVGYNQDSKQKKQEEMVIRGMNKLFVTNTVGKVYAENRAFQSYIKKVTQIDFAQEEQKDPYILPEFMTKGEINCVFAGHLHGINRNPTYMIRLFNLMENENINLILMGKFEEFDEDYFKTFSQKMGSRLTVIDDPNPDEVFGAMHHANILLNVGPKNANQLPTKILDFLSMGKPVISFSKNVHNPLSRYFAQYRELHLEIFEGGPVNQIGADRLQAFILYSCSKQNKFKQHASLQSAIKSEKGGVAVSDTIKDIFQKGDFK